MATDIAPTLIGVINAELPTDLGLASAAARQPGWSVQSLAVDESASDTLAGLIVDVPLQQRAEVLARLAPLWRVPILIESPVAADLEHARVLEGLAVDNAVVAANPLRYGLHTRRLLEELAREHDPLATFFAAWRFRAQSTAEQALPQLLDYLRAVCADEPWRISATQHRDRSVLTVTLRYESDVLGSIEVGRHLPDSFPTASELVVECFCHSSSYACLPGNQTVSVYGRGHVRVRLAARPGRCDRRFVCRVAARRGAPTWRACQRSDSLAARRAHQPGTPVRFGSRYSVEAFR